MNIYVPGKGTLNPDIAIIGEAPSYEEEEQLTPFVGASGRFLNGLLSEAGINRESCWVTNVCKYRVPSNPKFGRKQSFQKRAESVGINLEDQLNELRSEISAVAPNIIIALGGSALWGISGKSPIKSWRGSLINAMGCKAIGTYHPAHILHQDGDVKGFWNKPVMVFDLKRALKHSHDKILQLPSRNLRVIKNSYELHEYIERNKNEINPAIDIEALNCVPICIGISFNAREGITVPLWNTREISEISNSELATIWKMLAIFLAKQDVIGQNFGYDRDKIRRLGFTVRSLHSDTMLKAFAINPELPKNLAFNTSIYTEEPYYKDEGMYEGSLNDLLIGCARDACVTKEVDVAMQQDLDDLHLDSYYKNFLLPLHEVYFYNEQLNAIEQNGILVDESIRKKLIHKYIEWDEEVRHELFTLTGEYLNTSSPKQVSELLYDKLKISYREGTGEEVLSALLNNVVNNQFHERIIDLILTDRRIKKTLSSYLYSPADYDGRMKSSYFICLETGRSATQQQEPPIRPIINYRDPEDNKKKTQARGMAFQTITKHGDIGSDIRSMLIADKGYVIINIDSSQAEARVVAVLSNDMEMLKLYDEHDIHALTASWFFGGNESDYSKKVLGYETPQRFAGKTIRHAGHLGASKKRAAIELNTQARKNKIKFKISESEADKALKIFHAKSPNIRGVFHAEVIRALKETRKLFAPVPYGIEADRGGTRIFFERWGDELFRQAFSYIPQRSVSENTKGAIRRIRARTEGTFVIGESHDAGTFLVRESDAREFALIGKEEFERPINFRNCSLSRDIELVIPADIEIGTDYMNLKKFKIEKELIS